jgi:hypothetical protein
MIEKIKEIFTGHIGTSGELTSLLKKHQDIFEYCSDILLNEPAYEKVSYIIICIVKRINFN